VVSVSGSMVQYQITINNSGGAATNVALLDVNLPFWINILEVTQSPSTPAVFSVTVVRNTFLATTPQFPASTTVTFTMTIDVSLLSCHETRTLCVTNDVYLVAEGVIPLHEQTVVPKDCAAFCC